jgi:hypothetical protein
MGGRDEDAGDFSLSAYSCILLPFRIVSSRLRREGLGMVVIRGNKPFDDFRRGRRLQGSELVGGSLRA